MYTTKTILLLVFVFLTFIQKKTHSNSLGENKVDGSSSSYNYNEVSDDETLPKAGSNGDKSIGHGDISIALEFIIHYYEMARDLESQLDKMHEYGTNGTYLERIKKSNKQGQLVVDKLEKVNDKLEALIAEERHGELTVESYKSQLINLDTEKKETIIESGIFFGNIKSDIELSEDLVSKMLEEFNAFLDAGETMKEYVSVIDPPISLADFSATDYEEGEAIDFELSVLQELNQLYKNLYNIKYTLSKHNENSEERNQLGSGIENYETETIFKFIVANKNMLGRYLPSIKGIITRIENKKDKVVNLVQKSEWKEHIDWAEKLSLQMSVCEERFFVVVRKTAIILREMMRDEL